MMKKQRFVVGSRVPLATMLHGLVAALAWLTVSCGGDRNAAESAWAGERSQLPGGAVLVSNPATGIWDDQAGWTLEETLRVGSLEGEGPDVFGRVAALEVDPAGRIYVFDGFARELRAFGPDGSFVGRFGRRGSGPGEFESVIGLSVAPDGAVWAIDGPNVRYTAIHGEHVATYRRASPLYRLPWVGGFTAEGALYDAVVLPGQSGEVLVRVDSAGTAADTFPVATPELDVPRYGTMRFPLPYAPKVLRAFDRRGYVWTAVSHEYRLVQMSFDGDTLMIVTRDVAAPPLGSAEQDSVRRYVRQLEAQFGVGVSDDMIPRSAPILRWFLVDDAGSLWVARAGPEGTTSLDVFDDAGRYLGEVKLGFEVAGGSVPIVRDDHLYAVTEGELGVPVIVRSRIGR
jgi:hypothetical protein